MSKRLVLFVLALALALPVAASAEGNYGYDKGFFVKSDDGNFSNTTYGWIGTGWQMQVLENAANTNTFALDTARVGWFGNLFTKNIQYRFEVDFADEVNFDITDAYANFVYDEMLALRAGQFKVPYNFEALVADNMLNSASRSLVNGKFTFERGVGVMLFGSLMEDMIEYHLAVMNSQSLVVYPNLASGRQDINDRQEFLYALRLMANLMGKVDYTMGDLKNSETPNIAVGLGFVYNTVTVAGADVYHIRLAPDVNVRYMGFSLLGEFHYDKADVATATSYGFTASLGYFLLPESLEVAARYSGLYSDAVNDEYEIGADLSYYVYGHNVKAILNYLYHKVDTADLEDHTIGLGAQVGFF